MSVGQLIYRCLFTVISLCVCLHQSKAGPVTDYVRGEDVLDIWFDSGASWAAVLKGTTETLIVKLYK